MKTKFTLYLLLSILFVSFTQTYSQVDRKEVGNLVMENIPEIPQQLKDRIFQYQNTRSASLQDWLHDGGNFDLNKIW